jgi:hypothetical protein
MTEDKGGYLAMLEARNFGMNIERSNEQYICYQAHPQNKIFNSGQREDERATIRIVLSCRLALESFLPEVERYLRWLHQCSLLITDYFEKELPEKGYESWFVKLVILTVEITFYSRDNYGATIVCGARTVATPTLEIDFAGKKIVDLRICGLPEMDLSEVNHKSISEKILNKITKKC